MNEPGDRREHVAATLATAGRHHHGFVPAEHRLRVTEIADLSKTPLERRVAQRVAAVTHAGDPSL